MRPSSISVALQKMELDGLIERKVKDDDQRYSVVCITSKGKKACEEMKKKIFELDNSFTSQLDNEELEIAKKVLIKLNNIFKGDSNENI
jgi:DNA-binding MarR family transcriptional regulator